MWDTICAWGWDFCFGDDFRRQEAEREKAQRWLERRREEGIACRLIHIRRMGGPCKPEEGDTPESVRGRGEALAQLYIECHGLARKSTNSQPCKNGGEE